MSPAVLLFPLSLLSILTSSTVTCTDDATLNSLMALVQQQASSIQTLQARMESLAAGQQQHSGSIAQLDQQLSGVKTQLNTRAYFTAHMSQQIVNIGTSNAPFRFDAVTENVGNAYNPLTGVFTAPYSGLYVFYAQLMKRANLNAYIHYAIDRAGTVLCINSVDAANDFDKSSCLATAHVQRGETVYVRRVDGETTVEGLPWCAFSGVLISVDGV